MSTDSSAAIVSKVWNYAHVLKAGGVGASDYVEQITYLLFLKMVEEMTELGFSNPIPDQYKWPELKKRSGDDLEVHYRHALEDLGKEPGLVGIVFRKARVSQGSVPFFKHSESEGSMMPAEAGAPLKKEPRRDATATDWSGTLQPHGASLGPLAPPPLAWTARSKRHWGQSRFSRMTLPEGGGV